MAYLLNVNALQGQSKYQILHYVFLVIHEVSDVKVNVYYKIPNSIAIKAVTQIFRILFQNCWVIISILANVVWVQFHLAIAISFAPINWLMDVT